MRSYRALVPLLVSVLFLVGCGPGGPVTHRVTGTVTFDGAPVESGEIVFKDAGGTGKSYADRITGGKFSLETSPGSKKVEITAMREVPGQFDTSNPGEKVPLKEQYIPAQYNIESTLTVEVTGADSLTFDLKSGEGGEGE
jgi:hypothetical protein